MSQAPAIALPRLSHIAKAIALVYAIVRALAPVGGNDTKDHTP